MSTETISPVVPPPVAAPEDQPQCAGTEAVATVELFAAKPETPPEDSSAAPLGVLIPPSRTVTFTVPEIEDRAADARMRSDLDLAEIVSGIGRQYMSMREFCRRYRPYIIEARDRFKQPGRRVPVEGKPTWSKFVSQAFGVTDRYVRLLLEEPPEEPPQPQPKDATPQSQSASASSDLTETERSTAEEVENHDGTRQISLYLENKKYEQLKVAEEGLRPLLKHKENWTSTDTYYEAIVAYAIYRGVNLDGENSNEAAEEVSHENATA